MNLRLLIIVFLIQLTCFNDARAETQDNVVGQNITIASKVMGENREIQIYLPQSYESSEKTYPVLYILDGQRLFLLGVSAQQTLSGHFGLTPEFIVVGIKNTYPQRFGHFTKTKFLDFIEQEVVSLVDKKYRTSDERLLFGWEFGGAFAVQSMIDRPHLFDAHIAASPFPLNVKMDKLASRIDQLTGKLDDTLKSFLYFTVSDKEFGVIEGTGELDKLLKDKSAKNLNWTYRIIGGEEHRSTPYATLYKALRKYFFYYPELAINVLADYEEKGGMSYVRHYNKTRAKQFGVSADIAPWTMYALVRSAMRVDNLEKFEFFIKEFAANDFFKVIQFRRNFVIADFYVKYKKYDEAIAMFVQLSEKNVDSARLHNAMGDVYLLKGDRKNALVRYQKAVTLAKAQKDDAHEDYQADLDKVL